MFEDKPVDSELFWDWTSGENIGFNNIPRLCWTEEAEKDNWNEFCFSSINKEKKFCLYKPLKATLGNVDGNWIDDASCWDELDAEEFLFDKPPLSMRLYGLILQSVWTPWTSNLCF